MDARLLEPRRRGFRLLLPSLRSVFATLIMGVSGYLLAIISLILTQNERTFWDILTLAVLATLITFIGSHIMDYLEQA